MTNVEEQPKSAADWLRSYGVTLLLVLVALHQMWRVHFDGLNAWRGGGFGMYSGFHPVQTDIWLTGPPGVAPRRYAKYEGTEDEHRAAVRWCLTYNNPSCLEAFQKSLDPAERGVTRIRLVRLTFDKATMRLGRRVLQDLPPGGAR